MQADEEANVVTEDMNGVAMPEASEPVTPDEVAQPTEAADPETPSVDEVAEPTAGPETPSVDEHAAAEEEAAQELIGALEAVLFAAGEPLSAREIKNVFARLWQEETEERRAVLEERLKRAMTLLRERWRDGGEHGFALAEVSEGLGFRSNPRYADVVRHLRESRPVRLSRAALETLAIVAYRQPATKPEVDHIRGVDCGGTLRLLLDRHLVRIVGKKEEPGRPLLYGTTKEFLSFFNLGSLAHLPSLREFNELTAESQEELDTFDGEAPPSLKELSESAKKLRLEEEPAVTALEEAVASLGATEDGTRAAFASQGIALGDEDEGAVEDEGKEQRDDDGE